MKRPVLVAAVLLLPGCDRANTPPEAVGTIPAREGHIGDVFDFRVDGYFADADGDSLTYTHTMDIPVARITIVRGLLSGEVTGKGLATVSITATDPDQASASQAFDLTVPNRTPVVTVQIPAQEGHIGDVFAIGVDEYFADADGDTLMYTHTMDNPVARITIVRGLLSGEMTSKGLAMVSITATDPEEATVSQAFDITVPNRAPTGAISNWRMRPHQVDTLLLEDHFTDEDADVLSYESSTSNEQVVSLAIRGNTLFATAGADEGDAEITVTAMDDDEASVSVTPVVSVRKLGFRDDFDDDSSLNDWREFELESRVVDSMLVIDSTDRNYPSWLSRGVKLENSWHVKVAVKLTKKDSDVIPGIHVTTASGNIFAWRFEIDWVDEIWTVDRMVVGGWVETHVGSIDVDEIQKDKLNYIEWKLTTDRVATIHINDEEVLRATYDSSIVRDINGVKLSLARAPRVIDGAIVDFVEVRP